MHCVDVNMYSLDSYVRKFVKSKRPIIMLSVDTEGWDFDVPIGGSLTLDRTYCLEFEYHRRGAYPFFCALSLSCILHSLLTAIQVIGKI